MDTNIIDKSQYLPVLEKFVALSDAGRRRGLLDLEKELENLANPFLKTALQLVIDDVSPDEVSEILERTILLFSDPPEKIYEYCMIAVGVIGIQAGYSPRILRVALLPFLGKIEMPN